MTVATDTVKFKRRLGLGSALCFLINSIIGSGIFVTPGAIFSYSGSVGLTLIIWVTNGVLAFCCALCYAELSTVVPRSGSDFAFLMAGLGPLHKFWGPFPGFSYCFLVFVLLAPAGVAVQVMVSANYTFSVITSYICMDEYNLNYAKNFTALFYLLTITYINARTVFVYLKIQNLLTVLKIGVTLILIGCGIYELTVGNTELISKGFEGTTLSAKNFALSILNGAWAYSGWMFIISVAEEVKKPERNIFLTLALGIPTVVFLYVLLNISYMTVLTKEEIITSETVAASFVQKIFPQLNILVSLGIAISTFGSAMTFQFTCSRIIYAAAQEGHLAQVLSFLHVRRVTPAIGVTISGALSCVVILYNEVSDLIEFLTYTDFLIILGSIVSLLILRKLRKDAPRPFRVPTVICTIVIMAKIFLFLTPLITNPQYNHFISLAIFLIGFILYYLFVYRQLRWNYLDKITYFIQVLFEVAPSEIQDLEEYKKPKVDRQEHKITDPKST